MNNVLQRAVMYRHKKLHVFNSRASVTTRQGVVMRTHRSVVDKRSQAFADTKVVITLRYSEYPDSSVIGVFTEITLYLTNTDSIDLYPLSWPTFYRMSQSRSRIITWPVSKSVEKGGVGNCMISQHPVTLIPEGRGIKAGTDWYPLRNHTIQQPLGPQEPLGLWAYGS